jgi:hypothetical protein
MPTNDSSKWWIYLGVNAFKVVNGSGRRHLFHKDGRYTTDKAW